MKNIYPIFFILACADAAAATTGAGSFVEYNGGRSQYLGDAANAWASILGTGGPGGAIAAKMDEIRASDVAAFYELVSTIAYNDTAMTLYQTARHIDMSYRKIQQPLPARRGQCPVNMPQCVKTRQTIQIDGGIFGSWDEYTAHKNSDFKTKNTGGTILVRGFLTDGIAMAIAYTRTDTDTHDTRVYTDATGNGITLGMQYLGNNGMFINAAATGGHTSWHSDKTIVGVYNPGAYDTDFISGQINIGINMGRGRFSISPQTAVRYTRAETDKHVDAAAQAFEKWWHNTLNASGQIQLSYDFVGDDFMVRPYVSLGAGYDVISHGTDSIRVRVLSGRTFDMPVDAPARFAFDGGAGIGMHTGGFYVGLNYKLDMRSDYVAHTGMLNLKLAF